MALGTVLTPQQARALIVAFSEQFVDASRGVFRARLAQDNGGTVLIATVASEEAATALPSSFGPSETPVRWELGRSGSLAHDAASA